METNLHLTGDGLRPDVQHGVSRTPRAVPDAAQRHPTVDHRTFDQPVSYTPPCPGTTDGHTSLVYETAPLAKDTVVAGNPRARLHLRSDRPAGSFSLQLYALSPDFGCVGGEPSGYRYLTEGGVDLRFVGDGNGDPWYRDDRYRRRRSPRTVR